MQLIVRHKAEPELKLPINYQHILQAIIYEGIREIPEYAKQVHDYGYHKGKRTYKLFQFSLLRGKYRIEQKKIIFEEDVSFEIRSVDSQLIHTLKDYFENKGITYGDQHYTVASVQLEDRTIESEDILVRMKTPITVHATDKFTKQTVFFRPDEARFAEYVNANFKRKYCAYTGVKPEEDIEIQPVTFSDRDKLVTKYKNFYISGWYGIYRLRGKRRYLDFLYQTGIGEKNAQGFGMFEIKSMEGDA